MAATFMKFHLGKVKGRGITEENGRLVCTCMKWTQGTLYVPCSHVWEAMRLGMDAHHDDSFSGQVIVPVIMQLVHGNPVLVRVDVRHEEARHGMRPFYYVRDYADDEFVAWLDGSEGRYAMRRVILEYLRSRYPDAPACGDSTHSHYLFSPKEREKLDLDSTSLSVLAGVSSILSTGTCWRCLHVDSSDLIPEL